ncbi:hypothetical protein [Arthrobacter oryzae]|uniref:hypothetical protein n=1 Tax=Arthrobacter oryzae TaxID=409290 RepID=UPI00273C617A|nr:hypothetical protein [Arthrobacter oryzae]WLQ07123.1 hypothetical protein Q8Z05_02930 [Arthrobacter oryzae]
MRVAALSSEYDRRRLYALSFAVRILLFLTITPIAIIVSAILAPPGHAAVAIWMAVALAISGLSVTWYGVGTGSPRDIALYEALPKTAAVAVSALLVFLTGNILWYAVALCLSGLVGIMAFMHMIGGWKLLAELHPSSVFREIWKGKTPAVTVAAAGVYSTTPVAVVSTQASAADVASFASADKLYRITLVPISVLSNTFQGWVSAHSVGAVRSRMLVAVSAHALLGLLGFFAIATAGNPATAALFGPSLAASTMTSFWYGLAFLAVAINTSTGLHILVPTKHTSMVFWSTVCGAAVGIPAMAYFSSVSGGEGGALGLALGEVAVCLVQFVCILWLRFRYQLRCRFGGFQRKSD